MCGRFVLVSDLQAIAGEFNVSGQAALPVSRGGDIHPGDKTACLIKQGKNNLVENLHWGIAPLWLKDKSAGKLLINARAETIAEKPTFCNAFQLRRCLVIADGFYEWSKDKKQYLFRLRDHRPVGLAGIYEATPTGAMQNASFVIITTSPNEIVAPVHNRMPVIIPADKSDEWLENSRCDIGKLRQLMQPYPASAMEMMSDC